VLPRGAQGQTLDFGTAQKKWLCLFLLPLRTLFSLRIPQYLVPAGPLPTAVGGKRLVTTNSTATANMLMGREINPRS